MINSTDRPRTCFDCNGESVDEASKLTASFESADGAWFDELYAKLVAEETAVGL